MATLVFKVSGEVMAKFCQNPDLCRKVKSAQISLMMPVASTQIFGFISTWPPWWFHVHHLRRASTSLEARLKNPSSTCFMMKQATGCPMHVLTSFSSTHWFWGANWQISSHLVLRPKPRNRCSDFVGQITKPHLPFLRMKPGNPSEWFWGQTTRTVATGFGLNHEKLWTLVLRLSQETRTSHLLVHGANRIQRRLTSRSSGHRVPDLCVTIPDPLHRVSYSCHDPRRCPPCRTCHLHTMRQANVILYTNI
jgi:hypothetical protein